MSNLPELLARVQAAKGPDREIDALVHCLDKGLTFQKFMRVNERQTRPDTPLGKAYSFRTEKGETAIWQTEHYSESLDALAALAERVLPGYNIESGFRRREGSAWAIVWPDDGDRDDDYHAGKAATEPLSRLAAILAAKIAKEGE